MAKQRNATPKSTRNLPREAPGAPQIEPKSLPGPFRVPRDPPELTGRSSRSPPKAKMVAKRTPWESSRDPKGAPGEPRDGPETKKNARGHHFSPEKIDAPISDRGSIDFSPISVDFGSIFGGPGPTFSVFFRDFCEKWKSGFRVALATRNKGRHLEKTTHNR